MRPQWCEWYVPLRCYYVSCLAQFHFAVEGEDGYSPLGNACALGHDQVT